MLNGMINFSIKHRFFVLSTAAALAALAAMFLRDMPLDAFPDVTNIQVEVVVTAPGKAPLEIEKLVTSKLENAMRGVPRMTEMRSVSKYGISVLTLIFKDGTDIYWARQQVSEKLPEAREQIGGGAEITLGPIATAMGEIYQYTLEVPGGGRTVEALTELRTVQDWTLAPIFKSIEGVNEVNSFGGYIKEYQVVADPERLVQYGLDIPTVFNAVESNNSNVGGGIALTGGAQQIIRGLGMINNAGELERIVVGARGGVPILLRDVAAVKVSNAVRQGVSYKDGKGEVVGGTVLLLRGSNSRKVTEAVEAKVAELNASGSLPFGIQIKPFYTRTSIVTDSVRTLARAIVEGLLIVIVVLYLFLLSLKGAFVTIAALPLAALLTFTIMRLTGLSGNLMSLGGLAISIGMIIDSTIIQVENVLHHVQGEPEGGNPLETVRKSIIEVMKPSIFGSFIIGVTFTPILALQGIEGKMFGPLAITVMLALLSSLLLSLLVTPAFCAFFLSAKTGKESPLGVFALRLYRPLLGRAMKAKKTVVAVAVAVFAAALLLVPRLGTEFVPIMDEGAFDMDSGIYPGASLETSGGIAKKIGEELKKFPELETVVSRTGWTGKGVDVRGVERSAFLGVLKDRKTWTTAKTREELFEKMRQALTAIPGVVITFSQPIQCRIDELVAGTRSQLAIRLYGEDLETLRKKGEEIYAAVSAVKGAADPSMEMQAGQPYINIAIDREKIARYGLNVSDINGTIETAMGARPAGQIYEGEGIFDIAVLLPENRRGSKGAIERLQLRSPATGAWIPLSELAAITLVEGPLQISRDSGRRRIIVETNVQGRDLGGFVADAQKAVRDKVKLPSGYFITWGGQFENQQRAMKRLSVIIPAAIALIFVLLAVTFGSLKEAGLVLLNLPLALAGGIFLLYLSGIYLSVPAAVGFIALLGVAVLNGVVLVTHMNQLRAGGLPAEQAAVQGAERRLRPVLMTAIITIVSLAPMLFATGPGAEVQRPLAVVVTGGLFTSTTLTLFIIPVLYGWFSKGEKIKP